MQRRVFLSAAAAAAAAAAIPAAALSRPLPASGPRERLARLERDLGGRIGLCAVDTGSGKRVAWRADERFAMCSTFKFLLAAAVLRRVDAGAERLDRMVR
ncbi:MAG: serine hydrolase, partial [Proteobacteria bacterium]|nr:serine hydrolase [Pseudomonadota bacterium]